MSDLKFGFSVHIVASDINPLLLVILFLLPRSILCFLWLTMPAFVLRDGVSESQFNQVLNIELEQIIKVTAAFGEKK